MPPVLLYLGAHMRRRNGDSKSLAASPRMSGYLSPAGGSLFHEYLGWWGTWVSVGHVTRGWG